MEDNRKFATFFADAPKGKKIGAVLSWIATVILLVALFVPGFQVKFQERTDPDEKYQTAEENSISEYSWDELWESNAGKFKSSDIERLKSFVTDRKVSTFGYLSNFALSGARIQITSTEDVIEVKESAVLNVTLLVVLFALLVLAVVAGLYTISWAALAANFISAIEVLAVYFLMFAKRFPMAENLLQTDRWIPALMPALIVLLAVAAILSVVSVIVSYAVHSDEDAEGDGYWDDDDENRNAPTGLIDDNTAPVTDSIPSASAAVATLIQMNTGKSFAIMNNTELVIGKGSQANVIVSNPIISRAHAKISCHNGICTIQDLGSKNGTFVGDQKISGSNIVVLTDGMYITLGNEIFQFKI